MNIESHCAVVRVFADNFSYLELFLLVRVAVLLLVVLVQLVVEDVTVPPPCTSARPRLHCDD